MRYRQRTMRRQLSLHTLPVLVGAVLMIIVGLLGMHIFSTEGAVYETTSINHVSAATENGTTGALSDTSAECNTICHVSTGPGHGHLDVVNACVLALLVGMLLLAPPVFLYRFGPLLWGTASLWCLTITSVLPRAPCLNFLSINRT